MSKKRYLVLLWLKAKNVTMEYVENLDVVRTLKALHRHDRCEVVDMEDFAENSIIDTPQRRVTQPEPSSWATRIRCEETGEEWDSVAECHRATGISFFRLTASIRRGKTINGLHFKETGNGNKQQ